MDRRLNEFLSAEEYASFQQAVYSTAKVFPDIIGVLGVGSLVQPPVTPDDFYMPLYNTARGRAYEQIRNPSRRRLSIHECSDLDIWLCTEDTSASRAAQEKVELGAIALLSELVSSTLEWGSVHWHNKKLVVLGQYYKNPEFYPQDFIAEHPSALTVPKPISSLSLPSVPQNGRFATQEEVLSLPSCFVSISRPWMFIWQPDNGYTTTERQGNEK
ncbi:MAG TPA: hypothetical protein VFV38_11920 [Ktedonobacteraceae bacterium]|nr:hypothetical protein [Ktedonobacteraceae bacterium]